MQQQIKVMRIFNIKKYPPFFTAKIINRKNEEYSYFVTFLMAISQQMVDFLHKNKNI